MSGDLDEWFARADDVLTDWQGDVDAMRVRHDVAGEPTVADSYYEQGSVVLTLNIDTEAWRRSMERTQRSLEAMAQAMARFNRAAAPLMWRMRERHLRLLAEASTEARKHAGSAIESPQARALRLRHQRNTGPVPRVGLDGHYRRS